MVAVWLCKYKLYKVETEEDEGHHLAQSSFYATTRTRTTATQGEEDMKPQRGFIPNEKAHKYQSNTGSFFGIITRLMVTNTSTIWIFYFTLASHIIKTSYHKLLSLWFHRGSMSYHFISVTVSFMKAAYSTVDCVLSLLATAFYPRKLFRVIWQPSRPRDINCHMS